jgi:hypothetical protein
VVSATSESVTLYQSCRSKAILLKAYAALVLILQIGFKLVNDQKFLKQYNWDQEINNFLVKLQINDYMPIIGFSKPSENDINILKLFLSPIIFYITSAILKDHFASKEKKLRS